MRRVSYERPAAISAALALGDGPHAAYYAGGTTLVDLMKLDVLTPRALVDINGLPLAQIESTHERLRLGALVRMSDAAADAGVRRSVPAIAEALEASASPQLRNMASLGGNLLQRTRCAYFRDVVAPCNKREPGSGCGAREGINAEHAILGTSDHCIAVNASDFAVVLTAFDALVHVEGSAGKRGIPISALYHEPGETPHIETALTHGELIVSIDVPISGATRNSTYVKVRDRSSYAFALAACAAGLERAADGTIADARVAMGGVGTIPWRARAAEDLLRGRAPDRAAFAHAARVALSAARPTQQNAYKVDLGMRAIVRALETVAAR